MPSFIQYYFRIKGSGSTRIFQGGSLKTYYHKYLHPLSNSRLEFKNIRISFYIHGKIRGERGLD